MSRTTSGYAARVSGRRAAPAAAAPAGVVWLNEIDIEGGDFRPSYDDLEDDGFGFQLIGGPSWRQIERIRWAVKLHWLYDGEADLDDGNGARLGDVDHAPVTVRVGFSDGF